MVAIAFSSIRAQQCLDKLFIGFVLTKNSFMLVACDGQ